jgi:hypothetical protein
MLVTMIGKRVHVTLSRRNLRQLNELLQKTDGHDTCLVRRHPSGVLLAVGVENDADHYDQPDRPEHSAAQGNNGPSQKKKG